MRRIAPIGGSAWPSRGRDVVALLALGVAFAIVAVVRLADAGARSSFVGVLFQLTGTPGCVSDDGSGGACADGRALRFPRGGVATPDGRNLYVASETPGGLSVFARDAGTGAITQLPGTQGCITAAGAGGCAAGRGLGSDYSVAISPDGRNVYLAGTAGIAVFARTPSTGGLTQLAGSAGCITPAVRTGCSTGRALKELLSITVSPDGRNVYAGAFGSSAVAIFARDTHTGTLTQAGGSAGCISRRGSGGCTPGRGLRRLQSVSVSPDGRTVYATAPNARGTIAVLRRARGTGALTQAGGATGCLAVGGDEGCGTATGLESPWIVAVSPDGLNAYVADGGRSAAMTVYSRNPASGALTQLPGTRGCVSRDGTHSACTTARESSDVTGVVMSPDGLNVYMADIGVDGPSGVSTFVRDPATGDLSQPDGPAGCTNEDGSQGCAVGHGIRSIYSLTASADNHNVYASTVGSHAVVVFARTDFTPAPAPVPAPPPTTTAVTSSTTSTTTSTTATTTAPGKADFVITELTTSGLTVSNFGTASSGPSSVTVSGVGSFDIPALGPQQAATVSWKTCVPGTTTAVADPNSAVDESDETNNTATLKHGC